MYVVTAVWYRSVNTMYRDLGHMISLVLAVRLMLQTKILRKASRTPNNYAYSHIQRVIVLNEYWSASGNDIFGD